MSPGGLHLLSAKTAAPARGPQITAMSSGAAAETLGRFPTPQTHPLFRIRVWSPISSPSVLKGERPNFRGTGAWSIFINPKQFL